jgi:hypothetical protein
MTSEKFESEANLIRSVLEPEELLEIQFEEETEKELKLTVVVTPDEYIQAYVRPLSRIGYQLITEDSSIIRLVFVKGETFFFRLTLTQAN